MSKKKLLSIVLIITGIILPLSTLPLSSEYYSEGSFFWNIVRNVVTGQVIVRESVFEVVPDRDKDLYREFHAYTEKHPEYMTLPEDEIIEKFYREHYRDKMYRMEFRLKMEKQKIITHKDTVAIPYRYIFIFGVVLILTGAGILTISQIRSRRSC